MHRLTVQWNKQTTTTTKRDSTGIDNQCCMNWVYVAFRACRLWFTSHSIDILVALARHAIWFAYEFFLAYDDIFVFDIVLLSAIFCQWAVSHNRMFAIAHHHRSLAFMNIYFRVCSIYIFFSPNWVLTRSHRSICITFHTIFFLLQNANELKHLVYSVQIQKNVLPKRTARPRQFGIQFFFFIFIRCWTLNNEVKTSLYFKDV